MRPHTFEYHRASDLAHALELLAQFGEDGRPLAGGQSLVPMMNLRLARPAHLIDINRLPLDRIEQRDGVLRIEALVRHQRYFGDALIAAKFPAFAEAVHWIGHPVIRRHGSIGGSISHADPTAELPAICVLYDAEIVIGSRGGERQVPAREFFVGAYVTAVEPGEMVVAVEFPIPRGGVAGAFSELGERRGDFAIASAGVALEHSSGRIVKAAIVIGGARMCPVRAPEAEAALVGRPLRGFDAAAIASAVAAGVDPVGDHAASAAYRKHLIGELTRRGLERARANASE